MVLWVLWSWVGGTCATNPAVMLTLISLSSAGVSSTRPPNILFILADDLGWNDVGWNNPDVITPNLNAMASQGIILTQSYSQPACTPSRAAYLTGYYPFHIGVQNYVVREGMAEYVPLNFQFLPEKLKEKGYTTHLVGKWHLGHCRRDVTPTFRGFDSFLGLYNGYNDYYTKKINLDPNMPGTIYDFFINSTVYRSPDDQYTTDIFTNRTIELIQQSNKDTPFFIALHYTAAHWPLEAPKKYIDMYPENITPDRRVYLGMVTKMDEGIGQVMNSLREEGILNNTIVIFNSDNGGDTRFGASNYPLKGKKMDVYEGGTRVPNMVYAPGILEGTPRVSDSLFHVVDWFSTILGAAGIDQNESCLDGMNQWDTVRYGAEGCRQIFIYNIDANNGAIRAGKYKLIEGDPTAFPAKRKRKDPGHLKQDPLSTSKFTAPQQKTPANNCHETTNNKQKTIKAFSLLTAELNIKKERRQRRKVWTLDTILHKLESFGPDSLPEWNCKCELYDLQVDPIESRDLSQDRPAVVLFLHHLLALYRAEEVEPVLKFPYEEDPRYILVKNSNITSNTWCEESRKLIGKSLSCLSVIV